MRWFRRRPRRHGRHELGHAVTGIPSQAPAVEPPVPPGPLVELGFKDGSTARLDPASEQARALEDLARSLRE